MFWLNFSSLCSAAGLSANAVAKELGIPSGSITAWSKGSVPRNNTLVKIANYFGVTTDFLLSGQKENPATVTGSGMNPDYDELTAENRALVDDLIAKLLKSQSSD